MCVLMVGGGVTLAGGGSHPKPLPHKTTTSVISFCTLWKSEARACINFCTLCSLSPPAPPPPPTQIKRMIYLIKWRWRWKILQLLGARKTNCAAFAEVCAPNCGGRGAGLGLSSFFFGEIARKFSFVLWWGGVPGWLVSTGYAPEGLFIWKISLCARCKRNLHPPFWLWITSPLLFSSLNHVGEVWGFECWFFIES